MILFIQLFNDPKEGLPMADDRSKNALSVPEAENAVNAMKEEIANEFDVKLGADTTARENGSVGGEMVKRMIQIAEESMNNRNNS